MAPDTAIAGGFEPNQQEQNYSQGCQDDSVDISDNQQSQSSGRSASTNLSSNSFGAIGLNSKMFRSNNTVGNIDGEKGNSSALKGKTMISVSLSRKSIESIIERSSVPKNTSSALDLNKYCGSNAFGNSILIKKSTESMESSNHNSSMKLPENSHVSPSSSTKKKLKTNIPDVSDFRLVKDCSTRLKCLQSNSDLNKANEKSQDSSSSSSKIKSKESTKMTPSKPEIKMSVCYDYSKRKGFSRLKFKVLKKSNKSNKSTPLKPKQKVSKKKGSEHKSSS